MTASEVRLRIALVLVFLGMGIILGETIKYFTRPIGSCDLTQGKLCPGMTFKSFDGHPPQFEGKLGLKLEGNHELGGAP